MYTHLVALSAFLILSSGLVTARPLQPSPVYQYRRGAAMTPAPAHVQPYHPGLAVVGRSSSRPTFMLLHANKPTGPVPVSRRFIKDADYASGSSPSAFFDKSLHKRAKDLPGTGSTTFRVNHFAAKVPSKLSPGATPTQQTR
ncbi:hypothetical protein EDB85DRAFT_2144099 [Lactarius pseudohatsudake]|nr:hypothetical protein EDB85DRAFT_2144099 [Lactarius pseudohatsudake]